MKPSTSNLQSCRTEERRRISALVQQLLANESVPMMYNGFYCVFACQVHDLRQRWLPAAELMAALSKLTDNWKSKGLDAQVMDRILTEVFAMRPPTAETT